MKRICWMAIAGLLASMCAVAQDAAAADRAKKEAALQQDVGAMNVQLQKLAAEAKIIGPEKMVLTSPVTGAPYSADEVTTFTQTLADGTRIQHEEKATVYRDGQGRTRRETAGEIMVTDPVAGMAYSVDPNNSTAHKVMVMRRTGPGAGFSQSITYNVRPAAAQDEKAAAEKMAAAGARALTVTAEDVVKTGAAQDTAFVYAAAGSGPDTVHFVTGRMVKDNLANTQSLGTMSIEGIVSEGTSTTETVPAGAIGNDRPIQVVNERWYSPELQTVTMTKHSDPRSGEEVFRLTNVRRGEPSPDLFQAPAGCQGLGPCSAKE